MSTDGFLDGLAFAMHATHDRDLARVRCSAGRRLGAYHIEARIGAGGMGEVYRARDTKLGRDVAIKILPRAFTTIPSGWRASSARRACSRRSIIPTSARSTASKKPTACAAWCSSS